MTQYKLHFEGEDDAILFEEVGEVCLLFNVYVNNRIRSKIKDKTMTN